MRRRYRLNQDQRAQRAHEAAEERAQLLGGLTEPEWEELMRYAEGKTRDWWYTRSLIEVESCVDRARARIHEPRLQQSEAELRRQLFGPPS